MPTLHTATRRLEKRGPSPAFDGAASADETTGITQVETLAAAVGMAACSVGGAVASCARAVGWPHVMYGQLANVQRNICEIAAENTRLRRENIELMRELNLKGWHLRAGCGRFHVTPSNP